MSVISSILISGPFSAVGVPLAGMVSTSFASPNWPDIFLGQMPFKINMQLMMGFEMGLGWKSGRGMSYFESDINRDAFVIPVGNELPKSRGTIKLKDKDPHSQIVIDPNYLDHPDDQAVLLQGIANSLTKHCHYIQCRWYYSH